MHRVPRSIGSWAVSYTPLDTPPASGKEYVEELEAKMQEIGVGEVASVMGRYYAMDRDNRWDLSLIHICCNETIFICNLSIDKRNVEVTSYKNFFTL